MKTIGDILTAKTSKLAHLLLHNQQAQFLNTIFHGIIDQSMTKHCNIVKIEGHQLLVSVSNAAWATKFRYAIPELLKNLRTQPEFNNITAIRYIIHADTIPIKKQIGKKSLSEKHLDGWRSIIEKLYKKP